MTLEHQRIVNEKNGRVGIDKDKKAAQLREESFKKIKKEKLGKKLKEELWREKRKQ